MSALPASDFRMRKFSGQVYGPGEIPAHFVRVGGEPLCSSEAAGGSPQRAPSGAPAVQGLSTGALTFACESRQGSGVNKGGLAWDSRLKYNVIQHM